MQYRILYIFFLITILSSCKKDKITLIWAEQTTPTNYDLTAISFTDEWTGYAVGGEKYQHGTMLKTTDGGSTWMADSLTNKAIYDIQFTDNGEGYVVGIDGYIFKTLDGDAWNFTRLSDWTILNAVDFYNQNVGVAVGGAAFKNGVIYRFGENMEVDSLTVGYNHELMDVTFTDEQTVHVVGYGIVMKSMDGGLNWTIADIQGDFFQAVHFPTSQVGYSVGFRGTIIKTTDGGDSWKKLRNGNLPFVSKKKFRDVFFISEEEGYIVGDEGLFWQTTDGGDSWNIIEGFPEVDLTGIDVVNGKGYISGKNGRIFYVEI